MAHACNHDLLGRTDAPFAAPLTTLERLISYEYNEHGLSDKQLVRKIAIHEIFSGCTCQNMFERAVKLAARTPCSGIIIQTHAAYPNHKRHGDGMSNLV